MPDLHLAETIGRVAVRQRPRPEPALAHRIAVRIHPEPTALVDPFHRHARQPGTTGIERARILVDDDKTSPRLKHPQTSPHT